MRKSFFPILLIVALAAPPVLCAQASQSAYHWSVPNFALYGGYSYVFRPYDRNSTNVFSGGMQGWDTALTVPLPFVGNWLDAKGDVSGFYRNDFPDFHPRDYFFLFGPQVQVHLGGSTLFADGLVGSSHLNSNAIPDLKSNNTLAVSAGAGIDIGFTRDFAWRLKGDFYNTRYASTNNNVHEIVNSNWRLATGPVLRW